MKVIYNRIAEEFLTCKEAKIILFEIERIDGERIDEDVDYSDYSQMDLNDLCDRLNEQDVYGCGTVYYIVDEDISNSDLRKLING